MHAYINHSLRHTHAQRPHMYKHKHAPTYAKHAYSLSPQALRRCGLVWLLCIGGALAKLGQVKKLNTRDMKQMQVMRMAMFACASFCMCVCVCMRECVDVCIFLRMCMRACVHDVCFRMCVCMCVYLCALHWHTNNMRSCCFPCHIFVPTYDNMIIKSQN